MHRLLFRHFNTMSSPWKEAATLVLAAKAPNASRPGTLIPFDYKLLMLKRSSRSGFMPSANVFPGGVLDPADESSEWVKLFESAGVGVEELKKFSDIPGPRPLAFRTRPRQKVSGSEVALPREVAFRICAIRETYEESGILLGRRFIRQSHGPKSEVTNSGKFYKNSGLKIADHCGLDWSVLAQWQSKVDSNANTFLTMCQEFSIVPDVWALREWFNWLTPTAGVKPGKGADHKLAPRRYDALFFLCCIDDLLDVSHCQREMVKAEWVSPVDALLDHQAHLIYLPPPQVFTCSGLCNHPSIEHLQRFSVTREQHGMERWLPVLVPCSDGVAELWPGDDRYPAEPDLYGVSDSETDSVVTLKEFREGCASLNRLELFSPQDSKIVSNVASYGHLGLYQGELRTPLLNKL
ncbi:nucleoside diphosphate-linked moiety X motif 19 [Lingula anatina]|uniref:Nucleoside diphosphate-linked moiety X motif 19 n=1 Tax=Lingula anatina TaxID=7574 RepID=A0A1S3JKM0_LINAN|nr:nucleoside diphosphate-linked moiety X motif 19 [Lingula anatina]|eukprot:XP_013410454.1 nucleoside diphosphate-linked moiety X motif 19 [Lingula anatina]